MKSIKTMILVALGYMLIMQQAYAQAGPGPCETCDPAVPEIDGSGAIIAIGLVVGLAALIREKFRQ